MRLGGDTDSDMMHGMNGCDIFNNDFYAINHLVPPILWLREILFFSLIFVYTT